MRGRGFPGQALFFLFLAAGAFSQTAVGEGPLLIPPVIYVGDRARLIVPVAATQGSTGTVSTVLDVAARLPRSPDVTVHRLELQSSGGKTRLLIDFTPYAVGSVALPPIEIGRFTLKDLAVPVASILAGGTDETLSPPAEGLPVPGTAAQAFGFLAVVALLLLASAYALLRGGRRIKEWKVRRRRNLALRSLRRVLARLGSEDSDRGEASLEILSGEFRSYLTYRSSRNCLALTPREFLDLDGSSPLGEHGAVLAAVFKRLDEARFGGDGMGYDEFLALLGEVERTVDALEAAP